MKFLRLHRFPDFNQQARMLVNPSFVVQVIRPENGKGGSWVLLDRHGWHHVSETPEEIESSP